jgi:hypothetical protein
VERCMSRTAWSGRRSNANVPVTSICDVLESVHAEARRCGEKQSSLSAFSASPRDRSPVGQPVE